MNADKGVRLTASLLIEMREIMWYLTAQNVEKITYFHKNHHTQLIFHFLTHQADQMIEIT